MTHASVVTSLNIGAVTSEVHVEPKDGGCRSVILETVRVLNEGGSGKLL